MKTQTIILFCVVIFAAVALTSADSEEDADEEMASMVEQVSSSGKGGKGGKGGKFAAMKAVMEKMQAKKDSGAWKGKGHQAAFKKFQDAAGKGKSGFGNWAKSLKGKAGKRAKKWGNDD